MSQPAAGTADAAPEVHAAPPPASPAPATAPAAGESPVRSALSVVATIGPPLTIVTSLMIYFGWARSDRQAKLMGLDVSLFGYTTQDYVLLSISTLFIPLMVVAAMGLGGLAVHHRVDQALGEPSARTRLRTVGTVALGAGLLTTAVAIVAAILQPSWRGAPLLTPIALALGTAVAAYGAWLADAAHDQAVPHRPWTPSQRALRTLLVGSIITLALFWAMSTYAGIVGSGYADRLARNVSQRPRVTAFSAVPLGIEAPGVREERIATLDDEEGAMRYRTTGLRLLARSGARMFLLHEGWTAADGTVIVLPDNEEVRWQFSR